MLVRSELSVNVPHSWGAGHGSIAALPLDPPLLKSNEAENHFSRQIVVCIKQ